MIDSSLIYLLTHEYVFVILIIIFSLYLVHKHRVKEMLEIVSASILVTSLGFALKEWWEIIRPENSIINNSYSYPSIHAAWIVALALLIYLIWFRKSKSKRTIIVADLLLGFTVLAIGYSRIYLGVHTTEDIVGGYAFGLIIALITFVLYNMGNNKKS